MHAKTSGDFGRFVGHAGAAGDAVNEVTGAFEDADQHTLGCRHFPQDIHVDGAATACQVVGNLGLRHAAVDRIGDEFLVPFDTSAAMILLRDQMAGVVE